MTETLDQILLAEEHGIVKLLLMNGSVLLHGEDPVEMSIERRRGCVLTHLFRDGQTGLLPGSVLVRLLDVE